MADTTVKIETFVKERKVSSPHLHPESGARHKDQLPYNWGKPLCLLQNMFYMNRLKKCNILREEGIGHRKSNWLKKVLKKRR